MLFFCLMFSFHSGVEHDIYDISFKRHDVFCNIPERLFPFQRFSVHLPLLKGFLLLLLFSFVERKEKDKKINPSVNCAAIRNHSHLFVPNGIGTRKCFHPHSISLANAEIMFQVSNRAINSMLSMAISIGTYQFTVSIERRAAAAAAASQSLAKRIKIKWVKFDFSPKSIHTNDE